MTAVLGIDAAWSDRNPSGVALAAAGADGWRLLAVSASYDDFLGRGGDRPRGRPAPVAELLARARELAGEAVSLVAVDMPLSLDPIGGYRASDRALSQVFGSMKCATRPPSARSPGPVSDSLRADCQAAGYPLAVGPPVAARALIEVYPHPALVRLTSAAERLTYKVAKQRSYWRMSFRQERVDELNRVWAGIVEALDPELAGAAEQLTPPDDDAPKWAMKAFEDRLDAVVCAYAGVCALEGRAEAYGDARSAIWVPLG
ncbi:MAG TPA: DUF429 domain-containing protein [Caulobacteraceae bacterium]|nr:DUF429 domain-containing protein [Caulobacteraceae bacterium]